MPILCPPLRLEISLDGSSKTSMNERIEEEENNQNLKENNDKFYDVYGEEEIEKPKELDFSRTQQKKKAQKLH